MGLVMLLAAVIINQLAQHLMPVTARQPVALFQRYYPRQRRR
jgi:F0F1-type ATP synthase membrane subunit c/vacuolar-type H+-ATPase subunit K